VSYLAVIVRMLSWPIYFQHKREYSLTGANVFDEVDVQGRVVETYHSTPYLSHRRHKVATTRANKLSCADYSEMTHETTLFNCKHRFLNFLFAPPLTVAASDHSLQEALRNKTATVSTTCESVMRRIIRYLHRITGDYFGFDQGLLNKQFTRRPWFD